MDNKEINQYIDVILGKECSVCPHNTQCGKGLSCDKNKAYQKMIIAGAEWQQQKAIEAFNEAMIYFESPDCPTAEEALKHFIACLGLKLDSSCSEKPNNWICGNCDAYCECSITGAKHDNPACPAFDNSVLSQLNSKDHETKTS